MHNAYKIGEYWDRILNYEIKSKCHIYNTMEDMEHILMSCKASGQETVWELTKQLCDHRGLKWENPSIGLILGCVLAKLRLKNGKPMEAGNRMYRIEVSESACLIWKLRCDWRIRCKSDPEKQHTIEEITNKWRNTLLRRVKLD